MKNYVERLENSNLSTIHAREGHENYVNFFDKNQNLFFLVMEEQK